MSEFIYKQVEKYRSEVPTADPFDLLEALGAVTVFSEAYSENGLRGYCAVLNGIEYVVINAKQSEEEQRIVAAHEAGHLILHADELSIGAMRDLDVYNATGKYEREANLFAADFLMDDADVTELMHEAGADYISVAQRLNVPAPFLAFKLFSMVKRGRGRHMQVDLNSRCLK